MTTFTDMGLSNEILKAVSALGFEEPTPVQEKIIPLMLEKQVDLVGLAQTGTGKTAAFGLPLIERINKKTRKTQGLILCPTRELCVQVAKDLQAYSKYVTGLTILAVYGGTPIDQQIKILRRGVQIIVATPGRLNDLIKRRQVDLSNVSYVVFDEADEMLQMGFQDELNAILAHTPKEKNTLLFSATMSKEVAGIASRYMTDPVELTIGRRNAGAENVRHEYYLVPGGKRYDVLKRIVDNEPDNYSIIFCRTRRETQEVADKLIQDGYNADSLHGELSQAQRDLVMKKFRTRKLQILVATDVAARGLDVNDLTHVINYNLPDDISGYTHRSGRTGRAGRDGVSIALIMMRERYRITAIEKKINQRFKQCRIPSGDAICKKQLLRLVESVEKVEVDRERLDPMYAEIAEKLSDLDREELIKRFVSLEFNQMLGYYKNSSDLNILHNSKQQQGRNNRQQRAKGKDHRNPNQQFARFLLNVGRRQGIEPQGLISQINKIRVSGRIKVGKIEIKRNSALLEVDSRFSSQIMTAFQQAVINGKTVSIKVAPPAKHDTHSAKHTGFRKGRKNRTR